MSKIVKLNLGNERGSILIEADDASDEKPSGRESVGIGSEITPTLASAFEQFSQVFEIAQSQLSVIAQKAQETSIEINAKISTNGNLIIVKGSAEASIKVTMKWTSPKETRG